MKGYCQVMSWMGEKVFITLTIGDTTVKKTGSEALQSAGKSSKSKTFKSIIVPLFKYKVLKCDDPTAKRHTRAEEGLSYTRKLELNLCMGCIF